MHLVVLKDAHGRTDVFLGADSEEHVTGEVARVIACYRMLSVHFVLQIDRMLVGKGSITAIFTDLFPIL